MAAACQQCGSELPEQSRFCPSCGTSRAFGEVSSGDRNMAMLCHLISFVGIVLPFGSILGPLVVWLTQRENSPFVDEHGKESINFQLSLIVYSFVGVLLLIASAILVFILFLEPLVESREVPISEVITMAERGDIDTIEVRDNSLTIITPGRETFTSRKEDGSSVVEILERAGVDPLASNVQVVVKGSNGLGSLFGLFINFLPLIFFGFLILAFFVFSFVVVIVATIRASNGEKYRYPLSIRFLK